ncbi:hypothetical protein EI94DRAFT_1701562 [Lactarius quietus]|nr:hypothetical protein EI94DRAFT_1701562 [Lactarius quietus]
MLFNHGFPDVCVALGLIKDCLLTATDQLNPISMDVLNQLKRNADYVSKDHAPEAALPLHVHFPEGQADMPAKYSTIISHTLTGKCTQCLCDVLEAALYFAGGTKSFAKQFQYLFPTYKACEGEQVYKVLIPMVALVVTALYATLYEWRTREQNVAKFSANVYMDVYNGHVNTLKHIWERCEGAFHLMMADIYTQANTPLITQPIPVLAIAELDLDNIDG